MQDPPGQRLREVVRDPLLRPLTSNPPRTKKVVFSLSAGNSPAAGRLLWTDATALGC
jgi:hypothetical protein